MIWRPLAVSSLNQRPSTELMRLPPPPPTPPVACKTETNCIVRGDWYFGLLHLIVDESPEELPGISLG